MSNLRAIWMVLLVLVNPIGVSAGDIEAICHKPLIREYDLKINLVPSLSAPPGIKSDFI